jgi:hypothetical protein
MLRGLSDSPASVQISEVKVVGQPHNISTHSIALLYFSISSANWDAAVDGASVTASVTKVLQCHHQVAQRLGARMMHDA